MDMKQGSMAVVHCGTHAHIDEVDQTLLASINGSFPVPGAVGEGDIARLVADYQMLDTQSLQVPP